jgi:hypothetical protein
LKGVKSSRDAIGAIVRVGDQTYEMSAATGYASSNLTGVHIWLGAAARAPSIEIRWPSGTVQVLKDVTADRELTVEEK